MTINPRGRRMLTEGQGQIFRYARVARNYVGPLAGFAVPAGVLAGWVCSHFIHPPTILCFSANLLSTHIPSLFNPPTHLFHHFPLSPFF